MSDKPRTSRPYRDPWQRIDDLETQKDTVFHDEIDDFVDELRVMIYLEPEGRWPSSQLRRLYIECDRLHCRLSMEIAANRSRCIVAGAFLAALVPVAARWLPGYWALAVPVGLVFAAAGVGLLAAYYELLTATANRLKDATAELGRLALSAPMEPEGLRVVTGGEEMEVVSSDTGVSPSERKREPR